MIIIINSGSYFEQLSVVVCNRVPTAATLVHAALRLDISHCSDLTHAHTHLQSIVVRGLDRLGPQEQ